MKTALKNTHVNLIKLQNLNNEQLIQAVLEWDEQTYCQFKFDQGVLYAKRMTDNDELGFEFLIKTRFFWQWWKNEWSKRDASFLEFYSAKNKPEAMLDLYLYQHDIYRLKSDSLMVQKTSSMVGYAIDEYMEDFNTLEVK